MYYVLDAFLSLLTWVSTTFPMLTDEEVYAVTAFALLLFPYLLCLRVYRPAPAQRTRTMTRREALLRRLDKALTWTFAGAVVVVCGKRRLGVHKGLALVDAYGRK